MLNISTHTTHADLGRQGASAAHTAISRAHEQGREATVLLAAAPSQAPVLHALLEADCHGRPVRYFHMDEYVGLRPGARQGFATWLQDHYFDRLPDGHRATFEPISTLGSPQDAAKAYAARLPSANFDLVLCGIGNNGHLAFNDPGCDLEDPEAVRYIHLAMASRTQQVDEGHFPTLDDVPEYAITLTVPRILAADTIVCSVLGNAKAEAMRELLARSVTSDLPATALKGHPDVTLLADAEAVSRVG